MIRFDQRNVDYQGTERVFKKVVHPGQNAIRFVDKDGVPLRVPNTAALSRLHSTYTVSPRGVPTRKTNHSYSGQLTQAKMQNLVNSLDTSSQDMASYTSMHSYGSGLRSAGSSRHYLSTAGSNKRRSVGQVGPTRSVKSMAKSANGHLTQRMLVSAPAADQFGHDPSLEVSNDSPQGKRLEKEWSALSQCRALKRSSEIVSHRVDRMYFMTGSKLKLQSKYHVEDDELRRLRELQVARASSRTSRSARTRKGDVYRPDVHHNGMSNGEVVNHDGVVVYDEGRRVNRLPTESGHRDNTDLIVSQKTLNPRPQSNSKSPIQGWAGEDNSEKGATVVNGVINENSLHNADVTQEEEFKGPNVFVTSTEENGGDEIQNKVEDTKSNGTDDNAGLPGNGDTNRDIEGEEIKVSEKLENLDVTRDQVDDSGRHDEKVEEEEKGTADIASVQKTEETSDSSDKDKTEVKTEDYLGK